VGHKPGGRLPLLSARPAVTPATLKRTATISLLGKQKHDGCEQFASDCYPTASRLRFEVNPGPSASESSTLPTRLPSHPLTGSTDDVSPRCLTTRGVSWSSCETSRCRSERCLADCCPRNTRGTSDTLHTSHATHIYYHHVTYSICRNRNRFHENL